MGTNVPKIIKLYNCESWAKYRKELDQDMRKLGTWEGGSSTCAWKMTGDKKHGGEGFYQDGYKQTCTLAEILEDRHFQKLLEIDLQAENGPTSNSSFPVDQRALYAFSYLILSTNLSNNYYSNLTDEEIQVQRCYINFQLRLIQLV